MKQSDLTYHKKNKYLPLSGRDFYFLPKITENIGIGLWNKSLVLDKFSENCFIVMGRWPTQVYFQL